MNDLISRQAAINAMEGLPKYFDKTDTLCLDYADVLAVLSEQLPAAQPVDKDIDVHSTDCISRQEAIDALRYAQHRFIVADEAGGLWTVKWSEDVIYFAAAKKVLADLPSAQPEIIRCKECKHSEHWYRDKRRCFLWVEDGIDVFDDSFCNYAERRTDG